MEGFKYGSVSILWETNEPSQVSPEVYPVTL